MSQSAVHITNPFALKPFDTMPGEIKAVLSKDACAHRPDLFSHAMVHNGLVYTAGQVGGDQNAKLVSDDVKEQTVKMIENIRNILTDSGSSLARVVKANIYMVNEGDYATFNQVYTEMMPDPKPPRACVFVAGLPGGAKVEMECVAAQD
ncbi:putative endoribonuclease L-PSP [Xylariomycetidae sp. FL0641]|nr:putative endoribonuclease L-PSP [Xylariomycetidae sp. FL0641]